MSIPRSVLWKEIDGRIEKTREVMKQRGYDALVIYGNNKVYGSLRYLTDYFPDRAGWTSLGPRETYLFEGAALVVPFAGEPVLLLDPGMMPGKEICVKNVQAGGFSVARGVGLSGKNIAGILKESKATGKVGIETWDRFPTPIYIALKELLPRTEVERSTVVEELRMIKSPLEIEMLRQAALVGDEAHKSVVENLRDGIGKTELEIIRAAEHVMRSADPIYEDSCGPSPNLICSGFPIAGSLLHLPDPAKSIERGNVVHWDLVMRYEGYSSDTSRTRVMGKATDLQKHAYEATLKMHQAVLEAAKPGVKASDLVKLADKVAREAGYELWDGFLGHGVGMESHERPDLVVEETELAANMVLAIEPRISIQSMYLVGNEDVVLVTEGGAEPMNHFEKTPLELEL